MTIRIVQLRGGEFPGIPHPEGRSSFLQTDFWAGFKRCFGWKDRRFRIEWRGMESTILVLERRLAKVCAFAYVPDGPSLSLSESERVDFLAELSQALRPELSPGCLFIRFDPPWTCEEGIRDESEGTASASVSPVPGNAEIAQDSSLAVSSIPLREAVRPALGKPLLRAATDIQPPDTVLLDLAADEERLLSRMKPKWRYNVKLAGKKGVEIEETAVASSTDSGASAIERFYRLYELTARRDRIALHPQHYYGKLAELASLPASKADLRIWIARYEGEDLAAIITLFMDGHAVYLYGASSDRHRNLMPAYALQWAAIRAAKASGCGDYDFYGIPPTDDPGHPMSGLYRFKTGFGGIILHKAGSWDYPFHAPLYRIYRLAEKGRAFWYKRVMKMSAKSVGKQGAAKARENLRESVRD